MYVASVHMCLCLCVYDSNSCVYNFIKPGGKPRELERICPWDKEDMVYMGARKLIIREMFMG